jgi:hypothetical protein
MLGFLYFWLINLLGSLIAVWYGKKRQGWYWREYFVMIFWPILGVLVLSYFEGLKILLYFLVCALIGFFLEIRLNVNFEKILGEKFYVYRKLTLKGYSSILTLPFWGAAGTVFLTIAKIFGL